MQEAQDNLLDLLAQTRKKSKTISARATNIIPLIRQFDALVGMLAKKLKFLQGKREEHPEWLTYF